MLVHCRPIHRAPSYSRLFQHIESGLEEYDRIIWTAPPVGAVTDAQVLGQQVDGCVLVVSDADQALYDGKAIKLLRDVNVNLLGGLLNNLSVGTEGYGQYYYTYYSTV